MFVIPTTMLGKPLPGSTDMQNGLVITTAGSAYRVVPAGVFSIKIRVMGAGGGGCGSTAFPAITGGGSGAWVEGDVAVTPGDHISFVIGAGGTGQRNGNVGNDGAQSTCTAIGAVAPGGKGNGLAGTGAIGGDTRGDGNPDVPGLAGHGGNGPTVGTMIGGTGGNNGASPTAGIAPGAGGGGAYVTGVFGGNGAPGGIQFTW